jgi:hypothetical protein
VIIDGDIIANIGAVTAGEAIRIDSSAIANSDTLSNISINNTFFDNNTNAGIYLPSTSHVSNLVLGAGNVFSGANQLQPIDPNFMSVARITLPASVSNVQTGSTYTVSATDVVVVANASGTLTLTLPSAASYPGRVLWVKTVAAQTVVSASSNVIPLADPSSMGKRRHCDPCGDRGEVGDAGIGRVVLEHQGKQLMRKLADRKHA